MTVRFKAPSCGPCSPKQWPTMPRHPGQDQGVYFMAERGESARWAAQDHRLRRGLQPGRRCVRRLVGTGARRFGGDDFGEFFDLAERVFAHILHSGDDLRSVATATHLSMQAHARCAKPVTDRPASAPHGFSLVARLRAASHALVSSPTRAAHAGTVPKPAHHRRGDRGLPGGAEPR